MKRDARTIELENCLAEYIRLYPAFRSKPAGAPGSPARLDQIDKILLEDFAKKLLKGKT